MRKDDSRDKNDCPTERGTAGRPNGRDDTAEDDSSRKTPPREDAAAQTRGCSEDPARPVESSARDENNLSGAIAHLKHGHVAREFDEAEDSQPDLYIPEGVPKAGGQRYRAEGETDEEWIESGYVVAVGGVQ